MKLRLSSLISALATASVLIWTSAPAPAAPDSPTTTPSASPSAVITPTATPTPSPTPSRAAAKPHKPLIPPPTTMPVQQRMPTDTRPPEKGKTKAKHDVVWYASLSGAYSGITMPFGPAAARVAYSGEIPLRLDREFLGARFVTPVGGSTTDGVTANSFILDRGGASSMNALFGLAIPTGEASWLAFDANAYMRAGNPVIARSWGALLPYGHFLDTSKYDGYAPPSFQPQFYRGMWFENTPKRKIRAVVGDYNPVIWGNVSGPQERNFVNQSFLTFRPMTINLSEMGTGSIFPSDRTEPELRAPARGADYWMQQGPFELEALVARTETHPSFPFDTQRYREAMGGRAGWQTPWWGAGFAFWHMYGDNLRVAADPSKGFVSGGNETLWAFDSSMQFVKNLHGYATIARSRFTRDNLVFSSKDTALVTGLILKSFPGTEGSIRLQYQSVDPNYEPLGVRQKVSFPENYTSWLGEVKYPFKGGSALLSVRQYTQMQPDSQPRGNSFSVADQFFPMNPFNQSKGSVLDWLVSTDFDLGTARSPWHFYTSWEQVHFTRGASPNLRFSATNRTVTQQMALLRYAPWKQWTFDAGLAHYASNGVVGTFVRNVDFNEDQVVPRLSVSYRPNDDHLIKVTWRNYDFRDGNFVSRGANDYSAHQLVVELESKFGAEGIRQPVSTSY